MIFGVWTPEELGGIPASLTLILLHKHRDTNRRRIVIQLVVYVLSSAKTRAYLCKSIAVEMGRISRYFSKVLGSGVNVTLLIIFQAPKDRSVSALSNLQCFWNADLVLAQSCNPYVIIANLMLNQFLFCYPHVVPAQFLECEPRDYVK